MRVCGDACGRDVAHAALDRGAAGKFDRRRRADAHVSEVALADFAAHDDRVQGQDGGDRGADLNPAAALDRDVVDGAGEGRDHVQLLDGGLSLAELRLGRRQLGPGNVGSDLGRPRRARASDSAATDCAWRWASSAFAVSTAASFSGPSRLSSTVACGYVLPVDGRQGADDTAVARGEHRGLVGLGAAGQR